jgi:starch synthase
MYFLFIIFAVRINQVYFFTKNRIMSKKRVLIITQEMEPFTTLSEISEIARQLPQYIQDQGMEIRVLMPKFGTINERRHRLHEVVRLSGMNIIVDDDDYPLIIKVASLPGARMQVYFLDNDEFFKRKSVFDDENGQPYEDNAERMIFFCKGAIEIVRKFGWAPDIVHCHGWMTGLVPFYLKTAYKSEPIFKHSKVIYSLYNFKADKTFSDRFTEKAAINNLQQKDLEAFQNGVGVSVHKGAIAFADGIMSNGTFDDQYLEEQMHLRGIPHLKLETGADYLQEMTTFYDSLVPETV